MQIGRLRHRVLIQNPNNTPDGKGGENEAWTDAGYAFCEIAPMTSKERWFSVQIDAEVSHKVTTRYNAAITAESQLVWGTRTLRVIKPPRNIDERDRIVEMLCVEKV